MAQDNEISGLPPDEPIEIRMNYAGKESQSNNADTLIKHLEQLIEMINNRGIEQGSLHVQFHLGMQRTKIDRLPNECDISYYPTGEFTVFMTFRFED